jgi:hypothetical protein
MNQNKTYRMILVASMIVVISLACGLTNTADNLREGAKAIETLQGIATEIDESGIVSTGQAIATEIDESGIPETAQAVATDIGELGIPETAQVFATQIVVEPGEVPPDVPIMEGEKTAFFGSDQAITYTIGAEFQDVLDYYERELTALGWSKVVAGSTIGDSLASLKYEKSGRTINLVITELPFIGQVTVAITFE